MIVPHGLVEHKQIPVGDHKDKAAQAEQEPQHNAHSTCITANKKAKGALMFCLTFCPMNPSQACGHGQSLINVPKYIMCISFMFTLLLIFKI